MIPHQMQAESAKKKAQKFLLDETFIQVQKHMDDEYRKLAFENATLQGIPAVSFFSFDGRFYPSTTPNGTKAGRLNKNAPPLHPTLLDKFDAITNILDDEMRTGIKNLFAVILSTSTNGIVLEALLPRILYDHLKDKLSIDEFDYVDQGFAGSATKLPDVTVQGQITMIRLNYRQQFLWLRRVLMDRLLLS